MTALHLIPSDINCVDYYDEDVPEAWKAAIEWLALEGRWARGLRNHVPTEDGQCARCFQEFPCLVWHLADATRRALRRHNPYPRSTACRPSC